MCPAARLQMGMGKTACAVGAIQMNPPPADWRKNRAWQSLRREDMLGGRLAVYEQATMSTTLRPIALLPGLVLSLRCHVHIRLLCVQSVLQGLLTHRRASTAP